MGVELFDHVEALLDSARDVSPVAAAMQAKARDVAAMARDSESRQELEELVRGDIVPEFLQQAVTKAGVFRNGWLGTLGTGTTAPTS
jgi:hypothetical protein